MITPGTYLPRELHGHFFGGESETGADGSIDPFAFDSVLETNELTYGVSLIGGKVTMPRARTKFAVFGSVTFAGKASLRRCRVAAIAYDYTDPMDPIGYTVDDVTMVASTAVDEFTVSFSGIAQAMTADDRIGVLVSSIGAGAVTIAGGHIQVRSLL